MCFTKMLSWEKEKKKSVGLRLDLHQSADSEINEFTLTDMSEDPT